MNEAVGFIKSSFSEVLNPKVLGFAFHRAWIATFFFSANIFITNNHVNDEANVIYPLSLLLLVGVMICGVLLPNKLRQCMQTRALKIASPLLMSVGSLLLAATELVTIPAVPYLCGLFTGVGSGLLLFYWAEQYGKTEPAMAQLHSALAFTLAIVIYALFMLFTSNLFYVISGAFLPLLSALALRYSSSKNNVEKYADIPAASIKTKFSPEGETGALRICFAALIISFVHAAVVGVQKQLSFAASSGAIVQNSTFVPSLELTFAITQVGSTLILVILIAASILVLKRSDIGFIYRFVLVFMIASVLSCTWLGSTYWQLTSIMINVGYSCFELIFWIALSNICYRYHVAPLRAFGLGRAGWVVGVFLGGLQPPLPFMNLVDAFGTNAIAGAASGTAADTIAAATDAAAGAASGTAASTITAATDAASNAIAMGTTATGVLTTSSAFIVSILTILLVITYAFILPERNVVTITTGYGGRLGALQSRCKKLASRFLLTQRETEVLVHLIKGRDTSHIQASLNISAGTVSTHRQRIYQKTNVHSRQELIDLLELTHSDD
ncbi:MAG: helix-turn-helix transcriptional regulator [Coriobacteriales bacterium]|jgi:DNA-binding CsgD family transcriptional regulator|nr:helix-turn-helix transcriptional regulator [Coriobacteriales bacterium]